MTPATRNFLADLDMEVWVPHYLPMWSSRAESAATYAVVGAELRLTTHRARDCGVRTITTLH